MSFGFMLMLLVQILLGGPLVPVVLSAAGIIKDDRALFHAALSFVGGLARTVGILLIPVMFQFAANKFFFFRRTWISYRTLYAFYDYNLTYANALLGLLSVASRFVLTTLSLVFYFPRVDRTSMPGPTGNLAVLDAGFNAYMSALLMEHRYNHPVVVVFCELMIEHMDQRRAISRLRRTVADHAHTTASPSLYTELQEVEASAHAPGRRLLIGGTDSHASRWQRAAARALEWKRAHRRRVLNRWRLALFLLLNPRARFLRWHSRGVAETQPELRAVKLALSRTRELRVVGV